MDWTKLKDRLGAEGEGVTSVQFCGLGGGENDGIYS